MEVTIKDVAKEAGVAISTVSKYMNGGTVRRENETKIQEAVKKLGYSPNSLARGLKSSRTYTVGLMIEAVEGSYWARLTNCLEAELQKMGYTLILCCHGKSVEQAREYAKYLAMQMVDGIFFAPFHTEENYLSYPKEKGIPLIALEESKGFETDGLVQVNYTRMAYELTEQLIVKGHEKIAIISGEDDLRSSKECVRGYCHACEDYDIPVRKEWIRQAENTREAGISEMYRLWHSEVKPTAVFAANYYIGLGALRAVNELKIDVPGQLSLVVIDDYVFSGLAPFKITAAGQPLERMAAEAARLFWEAVEMQGQPRSKRVRVTGEMIPGESVDVPRKE